jgi:hypothetical protein
MQGGDEKELISYLEGLCRMEQLDAMELISPSEAPVFEKYDNCVPMELLHRAYATDKLNTEEAQMRLLQIADE